MMALAGVELETLVSEPDALTIRPPKSNVALSLLVGINNTFGARFIQQIVISFILQVLLEIKLFETPT